MPLLLENASLRGFLAEKRGNFAVIFALTLVPIMALGGAAVDYSRIYSAESKLQDATDAGALAAATSGKPVNQMQQLAEDFVHANAPGLDAAVKTTINSHDLVVEASATVPLPVLSAFGKPEMVVSVTSQVESVMPLAGGSVAVNDPGFSRKVANMRRRLARATRRMSKYQREAITRQVDLAIKAAQSRQGAVRLAN
jgi:Flp pilus assembly protein TadG